MKLFLGGSFKTARIVYIMNTILLKKLNDITKTKHNLHKNINILAKRLFCNIDIFVLYKIAGVNIMGANGQFKQKIRVIYIFNKTNHLKLANYLVYYT